VNAIETRRARLLTEWGRIIVANADSGKLGGGKPICIQKAETIAGPRAGAVEFLCGNLDGGRLLKALSRDNCAAVAQMIPWEFVGTPSVGLRGRWVRVEAGWPTHLATTMIRLRDVCDKPGADGRWLAGVSETGAFVWPQLDDATSQYLLAGATGSGKSIALQNAIVQLWADPDNQLVLCDGKGGESLKPLEPLAVGPCAIEPHQIRAAMAWTVQTMIDRRQTGNARGHVILVFDEIQQFVDDNAVVGMLKTLTAQGRSAGVHCLVSTQHPTVGAFGDSATRRNLTGRLAFHVGDADASRVAVGGADPRADKLLGAGDGYVISPSHRYRVQGCFVDDKDISAAIYDAKGRAGAWLFQDWPAYDPCDIGGGQSSGSGQSGGSNGGYVKNAGNTRKQWSEIEIAAALAAALAGEGRGEMINRADRWGTQIGSGRGRDLVKLGRAVKNILETYGFGIAPPIPTAAAGA